MGIIYEANYGDDTCPIQEEVKCYPKIIEYKNNVIVKEVVTSNTTIDCFAEVVEELDNAREKEDILERRYK